MKTSPIRNQNPKLKIGFLSYYPPTYGGATRLATRMAGDLTEKGHEVRFIGYDTDINPKSLRQQGIHLHKVKKIKFPANNNQPYIWTLASKLVNVHKKHNLDLVHVHYAIPYAASAYLAREQARSQGKDLPYIVTGHGTDVHTYGGLRDINPILALALDSANATTFVGQGLQDRATMPVREGGLGLKSKGRLITNFIETDNFYREKNDVRKKQGIPSEAFVVGHASNFAPVKQTYHFLDLARNLARRDKLDKIYFLMCGAGDLKEQLQSQVASLGMEGNFKFLGKLTPEKMRAAYSAMDVSLLPSKIEGCPLAALESMACETPVIGTRVEGISTTINEGETGWLFRPEKINELAERILELKGDKRSVKEAGKKARKEILENHSVDKVMKDYIDLYYEVIGGN